MRIGYETLREQTNPHPKGGEMRIIAIIFIILGIGIWVFDSLKVKRILYFSEHMIKQEGNYIQAVWKVPEDCDKVVGTSITYMSNNILKRR